MIDLLMWMHRKLKGVPFGESLLTEIDKLINETMKQKWSVGFNDQGMGYGDYAVLMGDVVIVKCPYQEIADHIVRLHNEAL